MKKILLSIITLTALTVTLYAACTTDVEMGGNKITGLGEPNATTDATTKNYVDKVHIAFDAGAGDGTNHATDINSSQKILFTETVDTNNNFNNSTFTAPVDGVYLVGANIEIRATSAGRWGISMKKNGSRLHQAIAKVDDTNDFSNISFSRVVNLIAGDTIEVHSETVPSGAQYWSGAINSGADNGGMYGVLLQK